MIVIATNAKKRGRVPAPTRPPFCALVRCASPCDEDFGETCDGCTATTVECSVETCGESPCCGCAVFTIAGRDVTRKCQREEGMSIMWVISENAVKTE